MVEKKASDLLFTTYAPVKIKIDGNILPVNKMELTPKMVKQAAYGLMNEEQLEIFSREMEIDFAVSEHGMGRFRVNVFHRATFEDALRNADSKNELRLRIKLESKRQFKGSDEGASSLRIMDDGETREFQR